MTMNAIWALHIVWRVLANDDGMSQFHEKVVDGRDPSVTFARFIVYKHL